MTAKTRRHPGGKTGFIQSPIGRAQSRCIASTAIERSASLVYGYLRITGFSPLQAKSIIDIARPIDLSGSATR